MKKVFDKNRQKLFLSVISFLLALSMVLAMIPLSAKRTEAAEYGAYLIWEEKGQNKIAFYGSFEDAWNGTFEHGMFFVPTTIGLLKDAHLYRQYYHGIGRELTIELNGHKLFKENNKKHADGAILRINNGMTVRIYGGRQNWVKTDDTVTFPKDPEDKIPGTYFDSSGLSQTTGTPSRNTVWNLSYYEWDGDVKYEKNTYSVSGGLITGGWSNDNGGAIQLTGNNTTLYLYDTTVAGNIAKNNGGGIALLDNYEKLYLNDSRIAFNNADDDDGGGIFVNGEYCKVYLTKSHVDYNLARDNGAGIAVNKDHVSIIGDAKVLDPSDPLYPANWKGSSYTDHPYAKLEGKKNPFWDRVDNSSNMHVGTAGMTSTVAYNVLWKADIHGGGSGIYIDGKYASVGGLNVLKNVARGGSSSGRGAIHLNLAGGTVANTNVWKNWSESEGGGIYVDNDKCAVTDVTVTENYSASSGWSGGGVYVLGSVNLAIGGKCIIKNNSSYQKKRDNLYLGYNNTMYARINPTLSSDSEVWLWQAGAATKITKTEGTYDDRIYWSDEDNYSVQYFDNILNLVKKTSNTAYRQEKYPEIPVTELASGSGITAKSRTKPADADGGKYTSENGNSYPLYQGVIEFPAFLNAAADLSSTFFYSDGYFDRNPRNYDSHLATCSLHLAMASFYSNDGNKGGVLYGSQGSEADGTFYPVKSNNIRQFLSDLGVSEENIFLNDFNIQKPGQDSIGVAIGSKEIKLGDKTKKLVIIGVRGAGYEQEWVSNMTLGASGEAKGFGSAADQVFSELNKYLERKGIRGESEDTVFWVAGYSRAGATSNLTGARIIDKFDPNGSHTFVYTFEAPQGGNSAIRDNSKEKYRCIHNIVNASDLVPMVGPNSMGFHRYGVDHFVPGGTADKTPNGEDKLYWDYVNDPAKDYRVQKTYTTWRDNQAYPVSDSKDSDYKKQKEKMEKQLRCIAGYDMIFNDYFHVATISYLANKIFGNFGWSMIDTDNSIMTNIPKDKRNAAAFSQYFLDDMLGKSVNYMAKKDEQGNTTPIDGLYRHSYSAVTMEGVPFERSAALAAGVVFSMNGKQMEQFRELAGTMMDRVDTTGLYVSFLNAKTNWQAYALAGVGGSYVGGLFAKLSPYFIVGGAIAAPAGLGIYNLIAGKKTVKQMTDELWKALSRPTEEELKDKAVREKYQEDLAKGYLFLQDILTEEQTAKLRESFPGLMFVLLTYLKADYDKQGNDMLGTMAYNSTRILSNHYPEINLAWLRSFDSYYDNQNGLVKTAKSDRVTSVKAPEALDLDGVHWGSNVKQSLANPVFALHVPDDENAGAAIYYRFRKGSAGMPDQKLHPYSGPVRMTLPEGVKEADYEVEAYAIHDGVRSETALIHLHIGNEGSVQTASDPGSVSALSYSLLSERGKTGSVKTLAEENPDIVSRTELAPEDGLLVKEAIWPDEVYVSYTEQVDLSVLPETATVILEDDTVDEVPVRWELNPDYAEPVNMRGYMVGVIGTLSSDIYRLNGFDTIYSFISVLPAFETERVTGMLTSNDVPLGFTDGSLYEVSEDGESAELIPIEVGSAGTYSVKLHLTSEEGAKIAYAVSEDESEPDLEHALAYEGPLEIGWGDADVVPREKTVRVRAYAFMDGKTDSGIRDMTFRLMTVPSIQSQSLIHATRLGVVFETRIPLDIQTESTYATFEVGGKDYEKELRHSYASSDYKDNIMPFVCEISALQMADEIFPTIHYVRDGEEQTVMGAPYSLKQEVDEALSLPPDGDKDEKQVAELFKTLADYGHYAQIYLSGVKKWDLSESENADHKPMPLYGKAITAKDRKTARLEVEKYKMKQGKNRTKIKKVQCALNLENRTELSLYLTMQKGFTKTPTAKLSDGTKLKVKKSGSKYKVVLPAYYAGELGKARTVILSDRTRNLKVRVSVLSYVQAVLNRSTASKDHKNAVTALYHYHQKIQEFIRK